MSRPAVRLVAAGLTAVALLGTLPAAAQAPNLDLAGVAWVGTSGGMEKLWRATGEVLTVVPEVPAPDQIAVDVSSEIVWAHTDGQLHAVSFAGVPVFAVPVPAGPSGGIAVHYPFDSRGDVWVAVGSTVIHVDSAGQILGSFTFADPVIGLGFDRKDQRDLWVGFSAGIDRVDGTTGQTIVSADLGKGKVTIYDVAACDQTAWAVSNKGVTGFDYLTGASRTGGWLPASGATLAACFLAASPTTVYALSYNGLGWAVTPSPSPLSVPIDRIAGSVLDYWVAGGSEAVHPDYLPPIDVGTDVTALGLTLTDTYPPDFTIDGRIQGWLGVLPPDATLSIDWQDGTLWHSGVDGESLSLTRWTTEGPPGVPFATCQLGTDGATCQATDPFLDGLFYTIRGSIEDFAGNQTVKNFSADIDGAPPAVQIDAPTEGAVLEDPLTPVQVSGSDAGSGVRWSTLALLVDGTVHPSDCSGSGSAGSCTPMAPLPVGPLSLTVSVEDGVGLVGTSAAVNVTVSGEDLTPPSLSFLAPGEGEVHAGGRPTLVLAFSESGGAGIDPASLSILFQGGELPRDCTFGVDDVTCTLLQDLPEGEVSLAATVSDLAGNTSSVAARTFTIMADHTDVVGTVIDEVGTAIAGATVEIEGKPGSAVLSTADGSFSIPDVQVAAGERLTVRAEDTSGGQTRIGTVVFLVPVYGGVTDAGAITVVALCDLRYSPRMENPASLGDLVGCSGSCLTVDDVEMFDDGAGPALYASYVHTQSSVSDYGVARLTSLGWDLVGTFDGRIDELLVFDDGSGSALYAGGDFATAGGTLAIGVARYRGGAWQPVGAGLDPAAWAQGLLAVDEGGVPALYAAGSLGSTQGFVSRWDGSSWTPVGSTFSGTVYSLAEVDVGDGPTLYAAGSFTTVGATSASRVARWSGTAWEALPGGGVGGAAVLTMVGFDDGARTRLVVGGLFSTVGDAAVTAWKVATWDGAQWAPLGYERSFAPASGYIQSLSVHDDGAGRSLYAAGDVERLEVEVPGGGTGYRTVNGVARWDGSDWRELVEPGAGQVGVDSKEVQRLLSAASMTGSAQDALYLSGRFAVAGDTPSTGVAEWSRTCDAAAPTIEIDSPPIPVATSAAQVAFTGRVDEPATVRVAGVPVAVAPDLSFVTPPLALTAGLNEILFEAIDTSGNLRSRTVQVFQDAQPPWIVLRRPADGSTSLTRRPPLVVDFGDEGSSIDVASLAVTVDGAAITADCSTSADGATCELAEELVPGTRSIAVTVGDLAGNTATATGDVTVDGSSGGTATMVSGDVVLPGGAPAAGARVVVLGHRGAVALAGADGSFAIPGVEVAPGEALELVARASDASGSVAASVTVPAPVVGGTTAVGTIVLGPLCAPAVDASFFSGVGIDEISWDEYPGGLDTNFVPRVNAAVVFDDGSGPALYVGGKFTTAGGRAARNVARWDGVEWTPVGNNVSGGGVNEEVNALAVFDDGSGPALYAGGKFNSVDGVAVSRIARWDGASWSDLGADFSTGWIQALIVADLGDGPALYVGGRFSQVGSLSALNVARWDGSTWSALGSGVGVAGTTNTVYALAEYKALKGKGQALYVGGAFGKAGGADALRVAAWDGSKWSSLDGGLEVNDAISYYYANTLTVFEGDLYVGGWFTNAGSGSTPVDSVARWDGRNWSAVGSLNVNHYDGIRSGVKSLFGYDDGSGSALYALGALTAPDWQSGGRDVARWDGTSWSGVGGGFSYGQNFHGGAFAAYDEGDGPRLFAGHGMSRADGWPANGVSRWDGTSWSSVPRGVAEGARSSVVFDDGSGPALYVVGQASRKFDSVQLSPVRWDGFEWTYLPRADASKLVVLDGPSGPELYGLGTAPSEFGAFTAPGIARWDGGAWIPLPPGLYGNVDAATRLAGEIVVAGALSILVAGDISIDGSPVYAARLHGNSWEPLGDGLASLGTYAAVVEDAVTFDDGSGEKLYLGGRFDLGGSSHSGVMRWDGTSWEALGEFSDSSGYPWAFDLEVFDNGNGPELYVGGQFEQVDGVTVDNVARWTGTGWQGIGGLWGGSVHRLLVHDDGTGPALYAAGGNLRNVGNLARWDGASSWSVSAIDLDIAILGSVSSFDDGSGPALYLGVYYGFDSHTGEPVNYLQRYRRSTSCSTGPDATPPVVSFTVPAPGQTLYSPTPSLELAYSDVGTGVDPSTLALTADGAPLAATCDAGLYSASCQVDAPLADGPVTFGATVRDGAGNASATATVSAAISTVPPTLAFSSPPEGAIVLSTPVSVSLVYTENANPATLQLSSSPVAVSWDCSTTSVDAVCQAVDPLPEGPNQVTATIDDQLGQASPPAAVSFVADTLAPTLTIVQPTDGATVFGATPAVDLVFDDAGAGVDPSTLALTVDSAAVAADCTTTATSAQCMVTSPLTDGIHALGATVADYAGRSSTAAVQVTVDTSDVTAPVITVSAPLDGSVTNGSDVTVTGSLSEAATLTLGGAPVTVAPDLTFSHGPVALAEGANALTLVATDPSNNSSSTTVTVSRDSAPPRVAFLAPLDLAYFDPSLEPIRLRWGDSGSGVDPASLALLADGATFAADCTFCLDGAECWVQDPFPGTVITLTAQAGDAAGNVSAVAQATFTSDPAGDLVAPDIVLGLPVDGSVTNEPQQYFSGSLSEPATLTLDGAPLEVDANNRFVHGPVTLVDGTNVFELVATDPAGNSRHLAVTVTLDRSIPDPVDLARVTVGTPVAAQSVVSGAAGTVTNPESGSRVRIADPATQASTDAPVASDGSFATAVTAFGGDELRLEVVDGAGNRSEPRYADVPGTSALPPDPATVAPPLDGSVATSFCASTSFLYTGPDPIQVGVDPADVDCDRVARIQGRVTDRTGTPLPGVRVSIANRPELGATLSRSDGVFDLVVHGGSPLLVSYWKSGLLPAHRKVDVAPLATASMPDVVLIPLDPVATVVDLAGASQVQTARGGVVTDADGTRQATLVFFPGTTATARLPNGAGRPLDSITVRASEYTVGSNGFEAMPADLPGGTSYTYAVELSVDEAGPGESVEFSRSVPVYVENFVGIPVGTPVPAGWYDRAEGRWVGAPDGLVIAVLGVDASGLAELDLDGSGVAAGPTALADLGIGDDELRELATLYTAGQSLWRVQITHCTPWDFNYWEWFEDFLAEQRRRQAARERIAEMWKKWDADVQKVCDLELSGSVIECSNQVLGEEIGLPGTDMYLSYWSDRVPGRSAARSADIPLSGPIVPTGTKRIEIQVQVAGQVHRQTFPPLPDQTYTFTWDGKDAEGRPVQGRVPATIEIGYVFDGSYQQPPDDCTSCFAEGGIGPMGPDPARREVTISETARITLGFWDAQQLGLGGWSLSAHHAYDPEGRMLYRGDGGERQIDGIEVTTTISGLGTPHELAASPDDDTLYYVDRSQGARVWAQRPGQAAEILVGTPAGQPGLPPTQGLAADLASFPGLADIATDPRNGELYLLDAGFDSGAPCATPATGCADQHNTSIWRLEGDGTLSQIFADPHLASSAAEGTLEGIWDPVSLAIDRDGVFYVGNGSSWVGKDGIAREVNIWRVVTGGAASIFVAGNLNVDATEGTLYLAEHESNNYGAGADHVRHLAIGPDGSTYFTVAGVCSAVIRRFPSGEYETLAGSYDGAACSGYNGDAGFGYQTLLDFPEGITIGPSRFDDYSVHVSDLANNRVVSITPFTGSLHTEWGNGTTEENEDGNLGINTNLFAPTGLATLSNGDLVVSDTNHQKVRKLGEPLPITSVTGYRVPSRDGSLIYVFDSEGRHLQTLSAASGSVLLAFEYQAFGDDLLLVAVTDADGNRLTLERDPTGKIQAVEAPHGHHTDLLIGPDGYLSATVNENGERFDFTYSADGLLETFVNPRRYTTVLSYDTQGRLQRDQDPRGGFSQFDRQVGAGVLSVDLTTAEGLTTTFVRSRDLAGSEVDSITYSDGLATTRTKNPDGTWSAAMKDGTAVTMATGPDPVFGMLRPQVAELAVTTPSGLTSVASAQRSATTDNGVVTTATESLTVDGRTTTRVVDLVQRTTTVTSPLGLTVSASFDDRDRVTELRPVGVLPVQVAYDPAGRLAQVTQGSRFVTYAYDSRGRLMSITDPLGVGRSFEYDLGDRVTTETLRDGRQVHYAYDPNGNVTSITPPSRPSHAVTYDEVDAVQSTIPPDIGVPATTTYSYDLDGRIVEVTRPDGQTISQQYEPGTGRLSTVTTPRGIYALSYDSQTGRPASVTSPDGSGFSFSFDGHLLTGVSQSGEVNGTITWTYDNHFQVTSQIVNGVDTVTFDRDLDGRLTRAGAVAIDYDPATGYPSSNDVGGVHESLTPNPHNELAQQSVSFGGSDLYSATYTRDGLGRVTSKTETVLGVTDSYVYSYDAALRLENVERNGQVVAQYGYDDNGNRLTAVDGWGSALGSYDDQDRLLNYGAESFTYTANGELMTRSSGVASVSYDYDVFGSLRQVVLANGVTVDYLTDASHRRIGKKVDGALVRGYVYGSGLLPAAELDGAGDVVSTFVYASRRTVPDYMVRGGVTYRFAVDALGSPRLVVDVATGQVAQRLDYDAFGRVTMDSNPGFQPFGYAGGLYDYQTGLVRFGARDYDASTGRWLAKDPVGFSGGDTNLYGYVLNDPINFTDPLGTDGWDVAGALIEGAAKGAVTTFALGVVVAKVTTAAVALGASATVVAAVAVWAAAATAAYYAVDTALNLYLKWIDPCISRGEWARQAAYQAGYSAGSYVTAKLDPGPNPISIESGEPSGSVEPTLQGLPRQHYEPRRDPGPVYPLQPVPAPL